MHIIHNMKRKSEGLLNMHSFNWQINKKYYLKRTFSIYRSCYWWGYVKQFCYSEDLYPHFIKHQKQIKLGFLGKRFGLQEVLLTFQNIFFILICKIQTTISPKVNTSCYWCLVQVSAQLCNINHPTKLSKLSWIPICLLNLDGPPD